MIFSLLPLLIAIQFGALIYAAKRAVNGGAVTARGQRSIIVVLSMLAFWGGARCRSFAHGHLSFAGLFTDTGSDLVTLCACRSCHTALDIFWDISSGRRWLD